MIETMLVVIVPPHSRDRPCYAERLLDLGNQVKSTKDILDPTGQPEECVATVNLALRWVKQPGWVRLRAIVEGWDRDTVIAWMN